MPSIAQEYSDPICSKKRRWEDGEIQMKLSSPRPISSRRIKTSKRQRFEIPPLTHSFSLQTPPCFENHRSDSYFPIPQPQSQSQRAPEKKKDLSPCHVCHRRPTVMQELDNFTNCEGCRERTCWICVRECAGFSIGGDPIAPGDLNAPGVEGDGGSKWGSDMLGDHKSGYGHRRTICSRCCVEKGTEGEVWCLGCLRSEGDG